MSSPPSPSFSPPFNQCLVVGINGQFGMLFARALSAAGVHVVGVDQQPGPAADAACERYWTASAATLAQRLPMAALQQFDAVLLCIPEPAVIEALPVLTAALRADAVLIDIASVKTRIAAAYRDAPGVAGHLSAHPMFGPAEGFAGGNVCVVRLRENEAARRFEALLSQWRCRVLPMSAEAHDRAAALVQALPHAALLAMGAALQRSGVPFELIWQMATPIHKTLLALLARIHSGDAALYWSIQADNPHAETSRKALATQLAALSDEVASADLATFAAQWPDGRAYRMAAETELLALASDILSTAKS